MIDFNAVKVEDNACLPSGTIALVRVSLAEGFDTPPGQPNFIGLDKDGITLKINLRLFVEAADGRKTSFFATYALPAVCQPDAHQMSDSDLRRVAYGSKMLKQLVAAYAGISDWANGGAGMQLNDWRDLDNCKVGAELGIFQATKGDMQTVKRFFPRAQLQQMQSGPVVERVQRGAGQGSWNNQPQPQYANNSNGWNSAPQQPAPPPQYQQQPSFGGWNSQPQQPPQQPQDDVPF